MAQTGTRAHMHPTNQEKIEIVNTWALVQYCWCVSEGIGANKSGGGRTLLGRAASVQLPGVSISGHCAGMCSPYDPQLLPHKWWLF